MATPSPRASYLPRERQEAARRDLEAALEHLAHIEAQWKNQGSLDKDERYHLKQHLHGAKAGVQTCKRYIAAGCPRIPGETI